MKRLALALGLSLCVSSSPAFAGPEQQLRIADVIAAVQAELIESQRRREAAGLAPLFYTKKFELELSFAVKQSADAAGKVSFWVVELGAGGEYETSEIQKIKLIFETPDSARDRPGAMPAPPPKPGGPLRKPAPGQPLAPK